MSKTDVAKATIVAESIRKGFSASVTTPQVAESPSSSQTSSTAISATDSYTDFLSQLEQLVNQENMQNQVQITSNSNDVVVSLKDNALYASGSDTLIPQAQNLMFSIGQLLTKIDFALVMVEGYTDTDPIHTDQFPDNLELSTARANGVNRVLQSGGVPSSKVVSLGWGQNDPVASNDTPADKALNRRVVITIFKNMDGFTPQEIIAAKDLLSLQSLNSGHLRKITRLNQLFLKTVNLFG